MAQDPNKSGSPEEEPTQEPSFEGRPASRGVKIGFLLTGSPDEVRIAAVLAALPLLDAVETVRKVWSDTSQAEFSGMSSFSAPPGELIDRLSDELLQLPGFRVQIQGVTRVPHPVLVFLAEPGEADPNAARRRTRARPHLETQGQAIRGTPRLERQETSTQPGRTPGAGLDNVERDSSWPPEKSEPPETTWEPGRMASTVKEPGFENVTPRLRPAARPQQPPIEPVVRSQYPRPSPIDDAADGEAAMANAPDIEWDLESPHEETWDELPGDALQTIRTPDQPPDTATIGTVVLDSDELPEEEDASWDVLVSDFYPDFDDPATQVAVPDRESRDDEAEVESKATPKADPWGDEIKDRPSSRSIIADGEVTLVAGRPRHLPLRTRIIEALFGPIEFEAPRPANASEDAKNEIDRLEDLVRIEGADEPVDEPGDTPDSELEETQEEPKDGPGRA